MKAKLTPLSIGMDGCIEPDENGDLASYDEASEVIEKLEAELVKLKTIKAPVKLSEALKLAERKFSMYADQHDGKARLAFIEGKSGEAGGHTIKARVNRELADQMLDALLTEQVYEHEIPLVDKRILATHVTVKRLTGQEVTEFLNGIDPMGVFAQSEVQRNMVLKLEEFLRSKARFAIEVTYVE